MHGQGEHHSINGIQALRPADWTRLDSPRGDCTVAFGIHFAVSSVYSILLRLLTIIKQQTHCAGIGECCLEYLERRVKFCAKHQSLKSQDSRADMAFVAAANAWCRAIEHALPFPKTNSCTVDVGIIQTSVRSKRRFWDSEFCTCVPLTHRHI